jgi:BCD family chlorophyll transporter-like MFS transporter
MQQSSQPTKMGWFSILRVSVINMAVGLMILPLNSTLNRVMIYEMGLSATLVAVLVSLRFITSPLRIWFGRISDTRPIAGLHRTWYILLGALLMSIGLMTAPHTALSIPRTGIWGILLSFLSFGLLGFGVNLTTPLYFALVSDQGTEAQRPRIVATMFVILGLSMVVASFVIGAAVEPYSEAKLFQVFYGTGAFAFVAAGLALIKLEHRAPDDAPTELKTSQSGAGFREVASLLVKNKDAVLFFFYVILTFIATEGQEVILEPFAAGLFDMTPGETTQLTGIFRSATLITMIAGAMLYRRLGRRLNGTVGIAGAALGLVLIAVSGIINASTLLYISVFGFGLGTGLLQATNLALMMDMTDERRSGMFMGAWGFAQAVGVGGGTILGGVFRDLGLALFGNDLASYITVFAGEVLFMVAALPLLWTLSVSRFRELSQKTFG